jgi:hypothetical protein
MTIDKEKRKIEKIKNELFLIYLNIDSLKERIKKDKPKRSYKKTKTSKLPFYSKPPYRTYCVWSNMINRCHNEKVPGYKGYGAKGIVVCDRWRKSYRNFRKDMGLKPVGYSIDRIDNDKGYSKENCRWATTKEQSRNRGNNLLVEAFGRKQILADWSKETGISYSALYRRLQHGVLPEIALSKNRIGRYAKNRTR